MTFSRLPAKWELLIDFGTLGSDDDEDDVVVPAGAEWLWWCDERPHLAGFRLARKLDALVGGVLLLLLLPEAKPNFERAPVLPPALLLPLLFK